MRQTTPARPSDTPTVRPAPALSAEERAIAWYLARLASAGPDTGDTRRFLRGLLAVALEGEVES